jgi:hypothetical protein
MSLAERRSPVRQSSMGGPSENKYLAILACGLLLFNIVVGVIVHRALPQESRVQSAEIILSHGD